TRAGPGSGASTRSTVVRTVFTRLPLRLVSSERSMLNFTSADVNGSPLWNFTPERSLNTHAVWPWSFHSVARLGRSLPSGRRLVRLSKMLNEMRMSFDDVLRCGSRLAMSPPWATTRSRFWVVCACAACGSPASAAAAPAAAILSTSRRVISVIAVSSFPCSMEVYMGARGRSCQAPLCGGGRLGLGEGWAPDPRLHVGDDVPLERDLDLVLLDRPPAHGREPPQAPAPLRHDATTAVDQRAPAGCRELLVLLGLGPAVSQYFLVRGLTRHEARQGIARE